MSGIMSEGDGGQSFLLPRRLKKTNIPKAFIKNDDARWVLCDVISDFHREEKQAIYYCGVLDVSIEDVAERIQLSPNHVASALGLYSERLESKLCFFRKIMSYDEDDLLPIGEILFPESSG
ncbi:MAG: hypothetical protein FWC66_08590 [Oscillospiraceae bacterium]|nr:hypothetical protein [Oscillospiraceae bacterium]